MKVSIIDEDTNVDVFLSCEIKLIGSVKGPNLEFDNRTFYQY